MRSKSPVVILAAILSVTFVASSFDVTPSSRPKVTFAQVPTPTPTITPTPCPDGLQCHAKRHAYRSEPAPGMEGKPFIGVRSNLGRPSDPCVVSSAKRTNYSLWIVDWHPDDGSAFEWVEWYVEKLDNTPHLKINSFAPWLRANGGFGFWGDYTAPVELSIEFNTIGTGVNEKHCWQWFIDHVKKVDSCDPNAKAAGRDMGPGEEVSIGGETDLYENDMGVQYMNMLAVKRNDIGGSPWRQFAPSDSVKWRYVYSYPINMYRYASVFQTAGDQDYGPSVMLASDTHFANVTPDFCNGRTQ